MIITRQWYIFEILIFYMSSRRKMAEIFLEFSPIKPHQGSTIGPLWNLGAVQ